MKTNSFYLIILTILLCFSTSVKGDHVNGGEITWKCLSSGKYVFYMSIYVNYANNAATWTYSSVDLNVQGSPLPRTANNNLIYSIPMLPDSNSWQNYNSGDLSPQCDATSSNQISCGTYGTTRVYYYKSSPVTLKGVPPTNGWAFIYQSPC